MGKKGDPLNYDGFKGDYQRKTSWNQKAFVAIYLDIQHLPVYAKKFQRVHYGSGWLVDSSKMPGVYLHLSGLDVEEVRLKAISL